MKKKYIIAIIIGVLLLAGLILVLTLGKDKGNNDKGNTENDIIVHESDEDTVEEKAEDGLKESDSEDGPVLNEDNMIDFNGGDTQGEGSDTSDDNQGDDNKPNDETSDSTENDGDGEEDSTTEDPSEGEEEEEDSKETGAWGTFY